MSDLLPSKIASRKDKKGFSNPRADWFRNKKFQDFIVELINSDRFKKRGYFNSRIANEQDKNHVSRSLDASKEIWKWINL